MYAALQSRYVMAMDDYARIEKAIHYIQQHVTAQPELADVAKHVHLSPYHFQRLFQRWAGVSPKKFLQFLSIEYAKTLLQDQNSLLDTSLELGLSGTSRLHDLFVTIEGMTPGEYKQGGAALQIRYAHTQTMLGPVFVASTDRGVCHLSFVDNEATGLQQLQTQFPRAQFALGEDCHQQRALRVLTQAGPPDQPLALHLKGTPFQLKVWQALLQVPAGTLRSYTNIAQAIDHPRAARAVGSAIGNNPVAYLIPCHRVIQSTGVIGQYRWGASRKAALIGWDAAHAQPAHE